DRRRSACPRTPGSGATVHRRYRAATSPRRSRRRRHARAHVGTPVGSQNLRLASVADYAAGPGGPGPIGGLGLTRRISNSRSRIAIRQVIENDQRVDANPLERARAFARLRDAFQLGQDQIAMRVGVHKSVVSRALVLLEQPKEIHSFETLRALDNWVEHGVAPDSIEATHFAHNNPANGPDRRMPLRAFPEEAQFSPGGGATPVSITGAGWSCNPHNQDMLQIGPNGRMAGVG